MLGVRIDGVLMLEKLNLLFFFCFTRVVDLTFFCVKRVLSVSVVTVRKKIVEFASTIA